MSAANKYWIVILIGVILLLSTRCAVVKSPTGGPKDTLAPQIKLSIPKHKQTNYKNQRIWIEFDEYIVANELQNELLIAPYLSNNNYTYKIIKGTVLELVFEKPFPDNTTITLNFRNGIKDQTEGNIGREMKIAFSTGMALDSLSISGNVEILKSKDAADNAFVGLYVPSDTLDITKHKPIYFTKTDKTGFYLLENLPAGNYSIMAFQDLDNNMLYQDKTEALDFVLETLSLTKSSNTQNFVLSNYDQTPARYNTLRSGSVIMIEYNEGLESAQILSPPGLMPWLMADSKTLQIHDLRKTDKIAKSGPDSLTILLSVTDSASNSKNDTIRTVFEAKKVNKKAKISAPAASWNPAKSTGISGKSDLQIKFEEAIVFFDPNKIKVIIDGNQTFRPQQKSFSPFNSVLILSKDYLNKAQVKIEVFVDSGAFVSASGLGNQADTATFTIKSEEEYGVIKGKIRASYKNALVQLINENQQVIQQIKVTNLFSFQNIEPGSYRLVLIEDINKNGKWDAGNLKQKRKPETYFLYKEAIKIKANWEIEDISL